MPNPPVPFPLKVLRGNPGRRPMRREPEPAREPECPSPPRFITGYAADERHRAAPELHRLGLLTVLDVMPLAAYCTAYSRWRTAEEVLARMADADPETHALLVKAADGNPRANPLVAVASRAADSMMRVAAEFGMTPVARARLAAGPNGQPPGSGKFTGLIDPA
jgi:P27 family predicted phage terminase small subunit